MPTTGIEPATLRSLTRRSIQGRIQAGPAGPFGPGLSLKRGPPFGVIYTTYFFVVTVNIFRKNFHETDFGYDISNTLNISSGIALE